MKHVNIQYDIVRPVLLNIMHMTFNVAPELTITKKLN